MENDRTEANQKNKSKKNVTFSESNPKSNINSSNNKDDINNISTNNESFIKRYSVCLEEFDNTKKKIAGRYSLRCKSAKDVSPLKRKSALGVIKEIIIGDNNEKVITNVPKESFRDGKMEKRKKKLI